MASVLLLCLTFVSGSKSWHHDICHSVSVVTSLPCTVDEGLNAMVWWRGFQAPMEDNWWACLPLLVLGAAGSRMVCDAEAQSWVRQWEQQEVLSTASQCSARGLLQTWISRALLGSTQLGCPVAYLPMWKTKPCSRFSFPPVLLCSFFSPSSPFSVFLKPTKMKDPHTEVCFLVLVYCDGVTRACTATEVRNDKYSRNWLCNEQINGICLVYP